jgi:protocatechuate 3,4-dioxygenase beta subunit
MKIRQIYILIYLSLIGMLAASCSTATAIPVEPTSAPAVSAVATGTLLPEVSLAYPAPMIAETEPASVAGEGIQPYPPAEEPPAALVIEPIEVTYFTPSQQEGPYYTVDKPADRDNDLVDFVGATSLPEGEILEFSGQVYDATGLPVGGIVVEIWQTDSRGAYLHPNDPSTGQRDPNFQFYGEAVTAADGSYSFRTILPGLYEPRPRHIHVKVRLDGQELLTTQFYFAGEIDLQGDEAAMLIAAEPGLDASGNPILIGKRDIILNADLSDR